jgi:hypothetical protein
MKLATSRSALRPFARQGHLHRRTLNRGRRSAAGKATRTARRLRSSFRRYAPEKTPTRSLTVESSVTFASDLIPAGPARSRMRPWPS